MKGRGYEARIAIGAIKVYYGVRRAGYFSRTRMADTGDRSHDGPKIARKVGRVRDIEMEKGRLEIRRQEDCNHLTSTTSPGNVDDSNNDRLL